MVLPRTEGRIEIDAAGQPALRLGELLGGAERIVRIFSDTLDPEIFDTEQVAAELSRLARAARQCEVRILIKDSHALVKRAPSTGVRSKGRRTEAPAASNHSSPAVPGNR